MIDLHDLYHDVQYPGGLTALVRLETVRCAHFVKCPFTAPADASTVPAPAPRHAATERPTIPFGWTEAP